MRRTRLAVYQRAGYRCQGCNLAYTVPLGYDGRTALYAFEQRGEREVLRVLELDHITPHHRGGRFEEKNLQALCSVCNGRKGAQVA